MEIIFRCGHTDAWDGKSSSPRCTTCGNAQVARVSNMPPPRFRGVATGPFAETVPLQAIAVDLSTKDAVPLKLEPTPEVK